MNSYFQDIWRMDWGLGNPNKTAGLIAILMVSIWVVAYIRRWAFWVALPVFTGLGICLMHTFSRGGAIALCAGAGVLLFKAPRPWSSGRIVAIVASIWVIVGASVYLEATKRFGQGILQEDRSITNRLELWKAAPRMMLDAPSGWGLGNAGRAYTQWYQSLDRFEEYRTLVNSHLTWLVEFGWPVRFLYLMGWGAVWVVCFPGQSSSWLAAPFAAWVTFFVAAFFSSVAESIWLWIVPVLMAVMALGFRIYRRLWPPVTTCLLPPAFASLALLLFAAFGEFTSARTKFVHHKGLTKVGGGGQPRVWILASAAVFGNRPARSLREYWEGLPSDRQMPIAYAESVEAIRGASGGTFVFGGYLEDRDLQQMREVLDRCDRIVLLNPAFLPKAMNEVRGVAGKSCAVFGEFSQSSAANSWKEHLSATPMLVEGVGEYLPNWPTLSINQSK